MMSNFAKVQEIVAEKLGIEKSKITMEASFIDDLGADSLDTVELIMKMEEDFGIEIPDEEAEKLKTVGDVVNYLDSKLK
jgi:acyl carrier protein